MRLLDLFCGAGGAAMGYHQAGFDEIVGVDIKPQPRYPFKFIQANALEYVFDDDFDLIHASPPCQAYSVLTKQNGTQSNHPNLIARVRGRLTLYNYVIENVVGAPLSNPKMLCGTMFGLRLRRHRLFETSFPFSVPLCDHTASPANIAVRNHGPKLVRHVPVYGSPGMKASHLWNEAMGIDWMTKRELTEAIPPAFTEYIGRKFLQLRVEEQPA